MNNKNLLTAYNNNLITNINSHFKINKYINNWSKFKKKIKL